MECQLSEVDSTAAAGELQAHTERGIGTSWLQGGKCALQYSRCSARFSAATPGTEGIVHPVLWTVGLLRYAGLTAWQRLASFRLVQLDSPRSWNLFWLSLSQLIAYHICHSALHHAPPVDYSTCPSLPTILCCWLFLPGCQAGGYSRKCSSSGRVVYPRIDPAIITLVASGPDWCLLGRKTGWPTGRWVSKANVCGDISRLMLRSVADRGHHLSTPPAATYTPHCLPCRQ